MKMRIIVCIALIFSLSSSALFPEIQGGNYQAPIGEMTYPHQTAFNQSRQSDRSKDPNPATTLKPSEYTRVSSGDIGLLNSSWPMMCHDTRHTSLSPYNTSNCPSVIKWQLITSWINGGIAIDNNGILYFGTGDWYMNAAYASNGTVKWRYYCGDEIDSTPAIGSDGTIYVGCWDCNLYAFNPSGVLKWKHHCGDSISYSSPIITENGTIYVGTMTGFIALSSNGTEQWRYDIGHDIYSSPVLAPDGTIIFGCWDNYIYSFNPNGTLRWRYLTGDHVMGSASIAQDGTIYIASWDDYLYALNPDNGTLVWRHQIGSGSKSSPAIGPDGTIYIGGDEIYAVYPNGTSRWTYALGAKEYVDWSSPAISADNIIYFGTCIGEDAGANILALNANGTKRWGFRIANWRADSSPAIDSDGTIYMGCVEYMDVGFLDAFGRGPIFTDANGPYKGYCTYNIQFGGTVWGGIPPYTYFWDFGDGTTSDLQSPTHNYTSIGNFTATFTVIDSEGNTSSDTAKVTITYAPPVVSITKPTKGLYVMNIRVLPLPNKCIAIGPITIEVQASKIPLGIERVEFAIDGTLKDTDTETPYAWTWSVPSFSKHTITVTAYDSQGDKTSASIQVLKLF